MDMKRLTFEGTFNLSKLHDELLAVFEKQWIIVNDDGEREALHTIEGSGDAVWLTVPEDTDEDAVKAIIAAHDPTAVDLGVTAEEARNAAIEAATTLEELKAALVSKEAP